MVKEVMAVRIDEAVVGGVELPLFPEGLIDEASEFDPDCTVQF